MNTQAQKKIAEIDRQIDAVTTELLLRTGTKPRSASGYQKAWDKYPGLRRQYNDLYCLRGAAQLERDAEEWKAAQSAARRERHVARKARPQQCPTCGQHIFAAIAASTGDRGRAPDCTRDAG